MNVQLVLELPSTPEELPLTFSKEAKQEPQEEKTQATHFCIGNCNICRYCDNNS